MENKKTGKMENKKIKINGMHCASCEILIKDILKDNNVKVNSVSHKTGDLDISYNADKIDFEKIKKVLAEEGHEILN